MGAHVFRLLCLMWLLGLLTACDIENFLPEPSAEPDTGWDSGIPADAAEPDITEPDDLGTVDVPFVDVERPEVSGDVSGGDSSFDPFDIGPDVDRTVYDTAPLIVAVYPPRGSVRGGDFVVIEGDWFSWDSQVYLDGQLMTQVDIIDRYEIAIVTPPRAAGTVDVKVVTAAGTGQLENAFTYAADLRLLEMEPATAPVRGGVPAILRGEGFDEGLRVLVGDREATDVVVVSDTEVRLTIPPGTSAGAVEVAAVLSSVVSSSDLFSYVSEPSLRALVPPIGRVSGGEVVRIDATGLDEACDLVVDGVVADITRSPSGWFEFTTPGGAAGEVDVALDCAERGADILAGGFTYADLDEPAIIGVSPSVGFTSGGEVVSVYGVGFAPDASIRLNGRVVSVVDRGPYRIDIVTPSADPGLVGVRVVQDESLELAGAFEYVARPEFDRVLPDRGTPAGGFDVVVEGRNLESVTRLMVDSTVVTLEERSATRLRFVAPRGTPGLAALTATVQTLPFATGLSLRYLGERRYDGFAPAEAPMGGGTLLQVTGEGFDASCAIAIDGVVVPTELRASGLLLALTPPNEPEAVSVEVVNCGETFRFRQNLRYYDPSIADGGAGGGGINGEVRVSVLDQQTGAPIEGATVMVQVRDSSPYVAVTSPLGQVNFIGEDLVGPQTITAFAEFRSAESIVNVNARDVTLLLAPVPPPPCEPGDPSCTPPPPDPLSEIVGFLSGMDKIVDPPPGAVAAAILETTRLSRGFMNPDPGDNILTDNGPFRITTRNGDQALVALCGYRFPDTGAFTAVRMGVVRGIAQRPGAVFRTAIECNIPLDQTATFKLTGAPALVVGSDDPYAFPSSFRARIIYDFGGEGVFEGFPTISSTEPIINMPNLPLLTGPLGTVRFDAVAGAYPRLGNFPSAESYVVNGATYGVFTMPGLVGVPSFSVPAPGQVELTEGYVEWTLPSGFVEPDLFFISATSAGVDFPRWTLFVPGSARSFNFADFPEFSEIFGELSTPGSPDGSLGLSVRAIDVVSFDFNDFTRSALRQRNWRASSIMFGNFIFVAPPAEGSGL